MIGWISSTWAGESRLSSVDPSFLGPLSGLMKLLRSKAAGRVEVVGVVSVLASLGARGRKRLQPASEREGSW